MPLLNKNKNEIEGKEEKNKRNPKKIIAIILGGTLMVTGVGYTYTKTVKAKTEANSEMVSRERSYPVEKGDLVAGIDSTGKIKFEQNTQNFEESVTIEEVFVKVGQRINKGDKIASLSTTKINEKIKELNNQLKELNSSSQQNTSTQENVQNGNAQENVQNGNAQENVQDENAQENVQDENAQENVSNESTQERSLNQDTKNYDIDTASNDNEINMKLRSGEVSVASNNNEINVKSRSTNVSTTSSNTQIDTSSKDEIKKQIAALEKLKKSPILYSKSSGIVFELGYSVGDETSTDTPVITIAEEGDVFAEMSVSQDEILNIEVGQQVYVWSSAYEGETFSGKVDFINLKPNSDSGSSTFSVRVKLDKSSNELLDGMSISSQFIIKELKDILTLSNKAITLKDGKQMVKVRQQDGTLKEKVITTGFSDGKKSEITSGLKEGDTVIVGGE